MLFSRPAHISMEGKVVCGLKFERLKMHHYPVLLKTPSIYRGAHRNTQGGGLNDAQLRKKVMWSHEDWHLYENKGLPGGHYWLVRMGETPIAIAGLHTNGRSGSIFIHRMYLSPGHSEEIKICIIRTTVAMFQWLRPEQLCVQTNSPTPSIYRKAGFELLSQGHMYRQTHQKNEQRSRRKRPMCFLIMPLTPGPLTEIEAEWAERREDFQPLDFLRAKGANSRPWREDCPRPDCPRSDCPRAIDLLRPRASWKKADNRGVVGRSLGAASRITEVGKIVSLRV